MNPVLAGVLAAGVGLWVLSRLHRDGRPRAPLVVAAAPSVALILTMAVPLVAKRTIAAFELMGSAGGRQVSGPVITRHIVDPLLAACLTFIGVAVIVAVWHGQRERMLEADGAPPLSQTRWPGLVLAMGPLVLLPALWLLHTMTGLTEIIGQVLSGPRGARTLMATAGMHLGDLSLHVSTTLTTVSLGGLALAGLSVPLALMAAAGYRVSGPSARLTAYGWLTGTVAVVAVGWCAVRLIGVIGLVR